MENLTWLFQLATTLGIGAICYFLKGFFTEQKANKAELNAKIEKEKEDSQKRDNELMKMINDINTTMPYVYVQKEDFIRVTNATDKKIDDMCNKIDKILDTVVSIQGERRIT